MSTEALLIIIVSIISALCIPVFLGLFAWILKELVGLTRIVASMQVMDNEFERRLHEIEEAMKGNH